MKHLILSAVLALCLCAVASAQNTEKKSTHRKPAHTVSKKTSSQSSAPAALDNRKNYEFKNGQRSTPTGAEATGTNTDTYVAGKKDSALKKQVRKVGQKQ